MQQPNSTDPEADCAARDALLSLERLCAAVQSGSIPRGTPTAEAVFRGRIMRALRLALIDYRPQLKATLGLGMPYATSTNLKRLLDRSDPGGADEEALLWRALLPCPDALRLLDRLDRERPELPEVAALKLHEAAVIASKISEKPQKAYLVRHLCQVMKKPGEGGEKGVLRLFALSYGLTDRALLDRLADRYVLFVEPTMGVMFRHLWLRRFTRLSLPVLVGAAGPEDREFLAGQAGLVPVAAAHGSFLEDAPEAADSEAGKRFDIIFTGTYDDMGRKRHALLLDLLRAPDLASATALVIGHGTDENVERFAAMVRDAGQSGRVTALANLPRAEMPARIASARVGVHLSLNENGPRCIPEYLRAGLPVAVSDVTAGVDFEMITPETGVVAPDEAMGTAVAGLLADRAAYAPREWFLANAGCARASARVNEAARAVCLARGLPWTRDVVTVSGSGPNRYLSAVDRERFAAEYRWLERAFADASLPIPIAKAKESQPS